MNFYRCPDNFLVFIDFKFSMILRDSVSLW